MSKKIITCVVIIFHLSLFINTKVEASSLYFAEDFNNIDISRWEYFGQPNSVYTQNGELNIKPPVNTYSSFIRSKNIRFIPNGNFSVEYKFKYPTITYAGTGIVIGESNPDYPTLFSDFVNSRILTTWQDLGTPMLGIQNSNLRYNLLDSLSTDYHIYKADYVDKIYKIYLDGQLKFTSPITERRVASIWMGNPGPAVSSQPWSELIIDYIKTYSLDTSASLSPFSNYDQFNRQVPIDRDLAVGAKVRDDQGQVIQGATVSARVVDPSFGSFATGSATTINNGDANFSFTPSGKVGDVDLEFSYSDVKEIYKISIYKPPIVIVPGMGASFNIRKFYMDDSDQGNWDWAPTAVNGWDKLISKLTESGYVRNSTFDVVFYDWRKTLMPSSYPADQVEAVYQNLKNTIDTLLANRPSGRKVNIVAHSFGGLVTRSMLQHDLDEGKVNQFISLGTPHNGAGSGYYIWNGGEMPPTGDAMFRVTMGTLLKIYQHNYGLATLTTVRNSFAGVENILPTYNSYIKRAGLFLDNNSLTFKNNLLLTDIPTSDLASKLNQKNIKFLSVYGSGEKTLRNINVGTSVGVEFWPDGKPDKSQNFVDGDDSVLPESAVLNGLNSKKLTSAHGDLPDNAYDTIFSQFKIPITPDGGNEKTPKVMMGVLLLSPATAQVLNENEDLVSDNVVWSDIDAKLSYSPDLPDGLYTIRVTGTGDGNYFMYVPYAGNTVWKELEFSAATNLGKVDDYKILLSSDNNGQDLSTLVQTTMNWQFGGINIVKKQLPIEFILKIPDNFDTDQLILDHVRLNKFDAKVLSSKLDKKGKKLTISLDARDVAKAINWKETEEKITLSVIGDKSSLLGVLKVRIPWGIYKKYLQ